MPISKRIVRLLGPGTAVLVTIGTLLAAPPKKATLRILSPRKGAVVRPGRKLNMTIAREGDIPAILIGVTGGPSEEDDIAATFETKPFPGSVYHIPINIPLETSPGLYSVGVDGNTVTGEEVASEDVEIDVEPAEIPPVRLDPPAWRVSVGMCVAIRKGSDCVVRLYVRGTYADGTEVLLNNSTRLTLTSDAPDIVDWNSDRTGLVGRSPGVAHVTVFGKYMLEVTVVKDSGTRKR